MNETKKLRARDHRYVIDRAATGVEQALQCSIIAALPEIKVVADCPPDKLGYYLGGEKIYIDKTTINLGCWFRDLTICHELLHWLGIASETTAHELDASCACNMPKI